MSKTTSSKNYNTEFANDTKNKTEYLSFEKLQNNFGTEIGTKIALNTVDEKPYFLCFLAITFFIETLLSLGLRTGNLVQKWARFLNYTFYLNEHNTIQF